MTTIQFSKDLNHYDPITIDANEYADICCSCNAYEIIPNDIPVKLYFDVDMKKNIADDEEWTEDDGRDLIAEMPRLRASVLNILSLFFSGKYDPEQLSICTSHNGYFRPYDRTTNRLKQTYTGKLSFHFVLNNMTALKSHQAVIVKQINEFANIYADSEDLNTYFTSREMFDESVYKKTQKLRSPYSSKPLENRPLKIEKGDFKMSCASGFIPQDAYNIVVDIPEKPIHNTENGTLIAPHNIEKNKFIFTQGLKLLTPYAKKGQYQHCISIIWAIRNVFSDRTMAHDFAKLGKTAYDAQWVDDSYDNAKTYGKLLGMGSIIYYMRKTDNTKLSTVINMAEKKYDLVEARREIIESINSLEPVHAVAIEDEEPDITSSEYIIWKTAFELEWCKIKNTGSFIRRYCDYGKSKLIFQNEKTLITSYKHECFYKSDAKGKQKRVSYIIEWLNDPQMKCYESVEVVPPPLICPPNVFNLWIPSTYESQEINTDDPAYNAVAVNTFLEHIHILSGRNETTYEYILNWIAHSIQLPAEKIGVALTLVSEQGIGKNIFTDTLGKLYGGGSKILETTQPERDVWGPFNDLLTDAYLVVLSETDKRNTNGHDGKIKGFITDERLLISPKGKTSFITNSYHRVIQATNTEDPTTTGKGDRRNVIVRCSDEKKGDTAYFTYLLEQLKTTNALRSIYWLFKTRNITGFGVGSRIETEYHSTIIEHNANPLELFMRSIVENHTGILRVSSVEFLQLFVSWKERTRFKFGENMNVLSLIKRIVLQLKLPKDAFYIEKGMNNNTRVIDTDKLAIFYNIEH